MKILSIETSCDETGISIMEAKGGIKDASFKVLANNASSQIDVHIPYGGVFPALAKREHIKNLPIILEKTLKEAKLDKKEKPIDLIAVTYGPGLEPALWTGIVFAKELADKWKVPVIPVNHMEGHMVSPFGKEKGTFKILKTNYPVLSLLVSGGHTELVLAKKVMDYKIIGQTVDDAVGEAFDKVARMLGLPYPGGPQISKLAEEVRPKEKQSPFSLPRPMLHTKDFNFSYSGLKTAVLYLVRDLQKENPNILQNEKIKSQIALEFENAAVECLVHKTKKAIEQYKIKTLIVAGGVAANKHLKEEIKKITGKKAKLLLPAKELSTDNSLMIGIAGYLNYIKNKKKVPRLSSIKATGNLSL
ncbi:tRNA (adenosine(37)-N6)-threonylcarbamoyltransferase complex transferase subunit TsaD [Candidatus Nomurabacteria bacterium]|nr:tRNA (adenosine(37)-N6)-threonylcarbamoyltransferase complex transferase subunit TsaD [Candidatus Nomurabacteria bacterium]